MDPQSTRRRDRHCTPVPTVGFVTLRYGRQVGGYKQTRGPICKRQIFSAVSAVCLLCFIDHEDPPLSLSHAHPPSGCIVKVTRNAHNSHRHPSCGRVQAYSNTNYTLLGMVVEAVCQDEGGLTHGNANSGGAKTAAAVIRERVLEPLGMTSAYLESHECEPAIAAAAAAAPARACSGSSGGGDESGVDGGSDATTAVTVPRGLCPHHHYATTAFVSTAGLSPVFVPTDASKYVVETTAADLSPEWLAGGLVMEAIDLAKYGKHQPCPRVFQSDLKHVCLSFSFSLSVFRFPRLLALCVHFINIESTRNMFTRVV